jgi:hypothetical protein
MRMRIRYGVTLTALAALAFAGTHLWMTGDQPSGSKEAAAQPVYFTSVHETYASQTAEDWATNADHVADVTMIAEQRGRTDGFLQDRTGTFTVNGALHSRTGAPALPAEIEMLVPGWSIDESQVRRPIVMAPGSSRFEVGHRYIVGLILLDTRCNPDDGIYPGGWSVIGSQGAIPFDDKRLGTGEVEGNTGKTSGGTPGSLLARAGENTLDLDGLISLITSTPHGDRWAQPGERVGC